MNRFRHSYNTYNLVIGTPRQGDGKTGAGNGIEAYIYAYPLVTMGLTLTGVDQRRDARREQRADGPIRDVRGYPRIDDQDGDRSQCGYALHHPVAGCAEGAVDRQRAGHEWSLLLLPMLDGWTTVFADPGKRTTGTGAQKFAITGPGWSGTLPDGVKEYKSATGIVWLLGRIYSPGTPEDYKAVHALQDQMTAVPLSAYGKSYTPAPGALDPRVDMKTATRTQVNAMDAAIVLRLVRARAQDQSTYSRGCADGGNARQDRYRAGPGIRRVEDRPDHRQGSRGRAAERAGQDHGLDQGGRRQRRSEASKKAGLLTTKMGVYGTDYRQRALVTAIALRREPSPGCSLSDVRGTGHAHSLIAARIRT